MPANAVPRRSAFHAGDTAASGGFALRKFIDHCNRHLEEYLGQAVTATGGGNPQR